MAPRVLIASLPRCGSTYLLRSLLGEEQGEYFPRYNPAAHAIRTAREMDGRTGFFKTHMCAPSTLPTDVRSIFLFGDPVLAILSTRQHRWDRNHFRNCGWARSSPPDMLRADDLGYEKLVRSWTRTDKSFRTLCVRYEALWDYIDVLAAHLERDVRLLERKPRRTILADADAAEVVAIEATHAGLIQHVAELPDCGLR